MNVIIPKNVSPYQAKINMKTKLENLVNKFLTTEENNLLLELDNINDINIDAIILTVLNQEFGFTAEQLRNFWDKVCSLEKAELETDEERCTYDYVPQVDALKTNLGIDIVAWENEEGR